MKSFLAAVILAALTAGHWPALNAQSQVAVPQSSLKSASSPIDLSALPPLPRGKSTILGGEIRTVDAVRDELTLKVFGQRPVKILFDERTQVFRDGNRISLRDLGPSDHASIQTLLDGTAIYALSVHMLSQSPGGELQGRVLSYNPGTQELEVSSAMDRQPIKLLVPAGTRITRVGQPGFIQLQPGSTDLSKGSLISVQFEPDKEGRGVASQISVLATQGAAFIFYGDISALDLHSGVLALVDPRDEMTYRISFDSDRLQAVKRLRVGAHVMVTADFDGNRYVASAIQAD
jgi:hypothetical protein